MPSPTPATCPFQPRTLQLPQHRSHADGESLDLPEAGQDLSIDFRFVQQEELRLGQKGRERVGQIVAEPA
jgi:hypothetical protein